MSVFKRLFFNAVSMMLVRVFEVVLQLAVLAFILAKVGKEYYGAALLILSVQAMIELARSGFQKATVKYVAEFMAKKDLKMANDILTTSTVIQGGIGFLGLVACLIIAPYVSNLFSLPSAMQNDARLATIILGVGIALTFFLSPWHNTVAGLERYDFLSLARAGGRILRAILIVGLLYAKFLPIITLVLANVVGNIFERAICWCFVKKLKSGLKLTFRETLYRHSEAFKRIITFSFLDFFHTLSGFLYGQGPLYILTHFVSLGAVGEFGIINNIASLVNMFMSQFVQVVIPTASRLQALDDKIRLKKLVIHGTKMVVLLGGAVVLATCVWIKPFLSLWLGKTYVYLAAPAITLLLATYLVNSLTFIHNTLSGVGKIAFDSLSSVATTALGLAIGLVLILFFPGHGLLALAVGLLSARFMRFVCITWYGTRVFGLNSFRFMGDCFFKTYLLLGASIVVFSLLRTKFAPEINTWLSLSLFSIAVVLPFLLVGAWKILGSDERLYLSQIASDFVSIAKRG